MWWRSYKIPWPVWWRGQQASSVLSKVDSWHEARHSVPRNLKDFEYANSWLRLQTSHKGSVTRRHPRHSFQQPHSTCNMAPTSRGYHKLAALMSDDKDIAIFRRFDDLNLLSLLSLQAEILELRQSLRRTCLLDDIHGQENEKKYSGNFKSSRDNNSEQYRMIGVLRHKLKDYSKPPPARLKQLYLETKC